MFNKKNKTKGFTLIELLVVVAIIGMLATIVLVSLNTARAKARDTRRLADLRQVSLALEMHYDDGNSYPGTSGSCSVIPEVLATSYLGAIPEDPGATTDYAYGVKSDGQSYVLKAILENSNNPALNSDVDGSNVFGCDCDDLAYCIRM